MTRLRLALRRYRERESFEAWLRRQRCPECGARLGERPKGSPEPLKQASFEASVKLHQPRSGSYPAKGHYRGGTVTKDGQNPNGSGTLSQLLTLEEVAELLKVPKSWVYERTRRRGLDRLPHLKLGKYLRFEEATVQEYLERQRVGARLNA